MEVVMQPTQLSSLVAQLNTEIQDQVIHCLSGASADFVIGWHSRGEEPRLDVRTDSHLFEIRTVVLPVTRFGSVNRLLALSGARVEVSGSRRQSAEEPWGRNPGFGENGSLVFTLASLEPEHVKMTATTIADTVGKLLDKQLEAC